MGHREDLLAGARRCLYEKGYGRTTARDMVTASGTNLASIGYHYGSKEALLNAALFEEVEERAEQLRAALAAGPEPTGDGSALERFGLAWDRVLESFAAHRELWATAFEALAQADRVPRLREALADQLQDGSAAWAAALSPAEPAEAGATGALCQALLAGVLVRWLVDPQHAPSGGELARALEAIATG